MNNPTTPKPKKPIKYLGKMTNLEMRMLLLETIQEEDPMYLTALRMDEGQEGVEALVEAQIQAVKMLEQDLAETDWIQKDHGGMKELAQERLLDYPGKKMPEIDPTLMDRLFSC